MIQATEIGGGLTGIALTYEPERAEQEQLDEAEQRAAAELQRLMDEQRRLAAKEQMR